MTNGYISGYLLMLHVKTFYIHTISHSVYQVEVRHTIYNPCYLLQIGDFGLARDLIGCEHYISKGGQIPVKWTAPEVVLSCLAFLALFEDST